MTWERGKGEDWKEGSVVRMYETRMRVKTVITTQPISKKNPPVTIVLIMLHIN